LVRQVALHWVIVTFGAVILVQADTIRLKNGTVVEGTIVSEDNTQLIVEVYYASGTITMKQTVRQADVAEITRLTEEQKAQRAMERAFEQVQEYQLDPTTSEPLSYYNHVINDVFHPFVRLYPHSPHEEEVHKKIAEWTAERDKVASGLARMGNEWIPRDDAERRIELLRAQRLLSQGQAALTQSNFLQALEQFKAVISSSKRPEIVNAAKHLYNDTSRLWLQSLQHQREVLTDEAKLYEDRVARTLRKKNDVDAKLKAASRTASRAGTNAPGQAEETSITKMRTEYEHAYSEHLDAARRLSELRQQLAGMDQTITQAQASATAYPIGPVEGSPPTEQPAANQPPPSSPPSQPTEAPSPLPTLLTQAGSFILRYWLLGLVILLGGLWGLSRLTTRR
jgi:hypothetical protein